MARLENCILSSQCDNSSRASSARSVQVGDGSDWPGMKLSSSNPRRSRFKFHSECIEFPFCSQSTGSDDLQVVRDSLRSLRTRFPGEDHQHQTIDTLEQSISSLMERLHVTESSQNRVSGSVTCNYKRLGSKQTLILFLLFCGQQDANDIQLQGCLESRECAWILYFFFPEGLEEFEFG